MTVQSMGVTPRSAPNSRSRCGRQAPLAVAGMMFHATGMALLRMTTLRVRMAQRGPSVAASMVNASGRQAAGGNWSTQRSHGAQQAVTSTARRVHPCAAPVVWQAVRYQARRRCISVWSRCWNSAANRTATVVSPQLCANTTPKLYSANTCRCGALSCGRWVDTHSCHCDNPYGRGIGSPANDWA